MNEDTSSYWRKVLRLDEPFSEDIDKKCGGYLRPLRRPLRAAVGILFQRICRLEAAGLEHLPEKGPFIIASNHLSALDFPAIFLSLPTEHQNNICVIYKKFFDLVPFARMFIKSFVPSFSVDSKGDFLSALSTASQVILCGKILYIAPEGTRSSGEILPFKVGVGTLAVETKTVVVPAYIKGTDKALPRGSFIPRKYPVKVFFGKPLYPDNYLEKKKNIPAYEVYREFAECLRQSIIDLKRTS